MFVCAFQSDVFGRFVCLLETGGESPLIDDRPENFFAGAFDFEQLDARIAAPVLEAVVEARQPAVVAVFQNKDVLFDRSFLLRMLEVIADCDQRFGATGWLAAAPEGVDENGAVHSVAYALDEPRFFAGRAPRAITAMAKDAYIINNRGFEAKGLKWISDNGDLESRLIRDGCKNGLVSVFHPRFALPVESRLTPRLAPRALHDRGADNDFAVAFREVTAGFCVTPSVSIVVRSIFNRPHLLHRLLVSIVRAEVPEIPVEVIVASTVPDARRKFAAVAQDHRRLKLRLVEAPPGEEPSRNRNLRAGVAAARHDYVWIIDDDDYVDLFAFSHLKTAFFGGARPLIFATADVHEETWTERPGGPPILSETRRLRDYPARGWRDMFMGFNRIPICGCLAPRELLNRRLSSLSLGYDLSEDYALFLSLLTAPDLPEIFDIDQPLSHISQRGEGENTMQMADRRPWIRNITAYLSDISYQSAAPGAFQLLGAKSGFSQKTEPRS